MRTISEVLRQKKLEEEMIEREKRATAEVWGRALKWERINRIAKGLPTRDGERVDIVAISLQTGASEDEIIELLTQTGDIEQRGDGRYYVVGQGVEGMRDAIQLDYSEEGREWMRKPGQNRAKGRHQPRDEPPRW